MVFPFSTENFHLSRACFALIVTLTDITFDFNELLEVESHQLAKSLWKCRHLKCPRALFDLPVDVFVQPPVGLGGIVEEVDLVRERLEMVRLLLETYLLELEGRWNQIGRMRFCS